MPRRLHIERAAYPALVRCVPVNPKLGSSSGKEGGLYERHELDGWWIYPS